MKPKILVRPPGPKAQEVMKRDFGVISASYSRAYPLVIDKAYGVNIQDVDGNVFLDFNSGIGVMNFGHGNPRILEAVSKQIKEATHTAFLEFYSDTQVKFSEELLKLIPHLSRGSVFLTNSGAESIEAAMKLARYHTKRKYFISFLNSFHGRTYGALSLTASQSVHKRGFGPFLDVVHVPYPNTYKPLLRDGTPEEISDSCIRYIEDVIFRHKVAPDEVAAMFFEPIQGEGGIIVPPPNFFKKLEDICDEHNILFIADEVQSGIFRTGKFLASEHFGIKPDIVCLAKAIGGGLPLGAVAFFEELNDWAHGSHASTFGGNVVACAAGLSVLDMCKDEKLGKEIEAKGEHIMKFLNELKESSNIIGDVRGKGLMIGVELVKDKKTKEPMPKKMKSILKSAFEKGLSLLSAGQSSFRIMPPLIMEKEDIDTGLEILTDVIKAAQ